MENQQIILEKKVEIRTLFSVTVFYYNEEGLFFFSLNRTSMFGDYKNLGFPFSFDGTWNNTPAFNINNIKSVELNIDSVPVSTFKRAVVGSLLFGGVGAIAGALSTIKAKPKSKISITVYFDSIDLASIHIPCKEIADANRLMGTIANLESTLNADNRIKLEDNLSSAMNSNIDSKSKISDEIYRLNNLLKEGIISQEEFVAFKKKLLDQ